MPDYRIRIVADPSGVRPGTQAVERRLVRTERHANRLRNSLGRLFALAGGGLVLTNAIRTYAKFEQRMSSVQAVSQSTTTQLALLREETRRLGITTRFTATQAAEGAELLARAGFTANQVLETLESTLRLAQAGELRLAQAASVTTGVLKGFQFEASEAGRVVDVLALGAARANTNVAQLGEAFKFVAPIAQGLGVEFEETTAALLTLANANLQGSVGGTALRRVLGELVNPGRELRVAMEAAGVTIDDLNPRLNKLTDILQTLRSAGIGGAEAIPIFKQRGGPAYSVLQGFIPQIERFTAMMKKANGSAEEMARIMDDNLNGALLAVASAWEGIVLSMGEAQDTRVEGWIRGLAEFLRSLARDITTLNNVIETTVILLSIKLARIAIPAVIKMVKRLTLAIASNPIGAIATAVTVAIAALVGFADQISVSGDGLVKLSDYGVAAFEEMGNALEGFKEFFNLFFRGARQTIHQIFGIDIGRDFKDFAINVGKALDFIVGGVQGAIYAIVAFFKTPYVKSIGDGLVAAFKLTWQQIKIGIMQFANSLPNIVGFIEDPIAQVAKKLQTLIGLAGGIAVYARTFGLITERQRRDIEDVVTKAESFVAKPAKRGTNTFFTDEEMKAAGDRAKELLGDVTTAFKQSAGEWKQATDAVFQGFTEGFEYDVYEDAARRIAIRSREIADQREKERKRDDAKRKAEEKRTGGKLDGRSQDQVLEGLSKEAKALLNQIDLYSALQRNKASLLEIQKAEIAAVEDITEQYALASGAALLDPTAENLKSLTIMGALMDDRMTLADERIRQVQESLIELRLQSLDASKELEDGFTRALIRIGQEAEDLASVMEASLNTVLDRGADALASFVREGQLGFKDFANAILDDLARIFARLLLIQAINVATGGAASLAGVGLQASSAIGSRASGGPVTAGREYWVGERGPERVRFGQDGYVERSEGGGQANVTVVNVEDPDEIPNAMNTPQGDRVFMNMLQRNRSAVRRTIG